ncbi:type 4a pilus biogenesis protein PilO [Pelotomaculum isophthalicicum JI]|uniref:Type 4a pilus biogenesis protein PilO n=1 Tax=Pelotomaculum isophthalicicum JI TaxID=947010 RepID=A0A9X4H3P2_9FIRM|nr:type 4a pilus biogenesis protein PilO [Pelotomaculum isophthalicicum]MDF9409765.1 type 4a pilus biogenesis protein PilO [Pelotomaculum isophthalicicum JI]
MLLSKKLKVKLNLSKREKILVSVFLLITACFLYYQYVFTTQVKKINDLNKDIKTKESTINQLTSQGYADIPQLNNRILEMNKEIESFYKTVPNMQNIPGLLVDFYNSSKKNNVFAQTITFGKLEAKDNYSSFQVSLDVVGTKYNVLNFIKEIEAYPRLSRISKIEFEPQENNMILAKISDEFYVLHDVVADPLDYPFTEGKRSLNFLYDLFNQYKVAGEVDKNGNIIVKNNTINNANRVSASENNKAIIPSGNTSGNTTGSTANKSSNNVNPYPWIAPVKQ